MIKWRKFDISDIIDSGCGSKMVLFKSPKFIDEDFNPDGILTGSIVYDGLDDYVFYTSIWDGVNDQYKGLTVDSKMINDVEYYCLVEFYEHAVA